MKSGFRFRALAAVLCAVVVLALAPTVCFGATTNVALTKWTPRGKARLSSKTTLKGDNWDSTDSQGLPKITKISFVASNRKTKYYLPKGPTSEDDSIPNENWTAKRVSRNTFFAKMRSLKGVRGCRVTWKWTRDSKHHKVRYITRIQYSFTSM